MHETYHQPINAFCATSGLRPSESRYVTSPRCTLIACKGYYIRLSTWANTGGGAQGSRDPPPLICKCPFQNLENKILCI